MRSSQVILLLATLIAGCSTNKGIVVDSDPKDAKVYLELPNQSPLELGQTPYELDYSKLPKTGERMYRIRVAKNSFESATILLVPSMLPQSGNLFFRLEKGASEDLACREKTNDLNKMAAGVATATSHINKKEFFLAEQVLNSLLLNNPTNPVLHSLLGNVHYLKKDIQKALRSYQRSLELDPDNADTKRIIETIQSGGGA